MAAYSETQDPIRFVLHVPVTDKPAACWMRLSQLGKSTTCKIIARIPHDDVRDEVEAMVRAEAWRGDPTYENLEDEEREEYRVCCPEAWGMQFLIHYLDELPDKQLEDEKFKNANISGLVGPGMIECGFSHDDTGIWVPREFEEGDTEFVLNEAAARFVRMAMYPRSWGLFAAADWNGDRNALVRKLEVVQERIEKEARRATKKGSNQKTKGQEFLRRFDRKLIGDLQKVCAYCGAGEKKLQHCKGCKAVFYCDRKCQKSHWSDHKVECVSRV